VNAPRSKVAILGAGAYGTALAQAIARSGRASEIVLIEHFLEVVEAVNTRRENHKFLPGIPLSPRVRAAAHASASGGAALVIVAVPTSHAAAVLSGAAPDLAAGVPILVGTKGFWGAPPRRGDEAAAAAAPGHPILVLGGGVLATELAEGRASRLVIGGPAGAAAAVAEFLRGPGVQVTLTGDAAGVAMGAALKNIYALGMAVAGPLCDGGDNWRAAFLNDALAEMERLGEAFGGSAVTLRGPAGLGDLLATGLSSRSRNRRLGLMLQAGTPLADAIAELQHRPEGLDALAWLKNQPVAEPGRAPLLHAIAAALAGDGGPVRACFGL
jgi:glycerol-3-phosphate dehydrogenase (NAD(P)+)